MKLQIEFSTNARKAVYVGKNKATYTCARMDSKLTHYGAKQAEEYCRECNKNNPSNLSDGPKGNLKDQRTKHNTSFRNRVILQPIYTTHPCHQKGKCKR